MEYTHEYIGLMCGECHMFYALTKDHYQHLKSTHKVFHCPNGHKQAYREFTAHDQEVQALKAEIERLKKELEKANMKVEALNTYYGNLDKSIGNNPEVLTLNNTDNKVSKECDE